MTSGALAQLGAHHTGSVGVRGSSPLCSTRIMNSLSALSQKDFFFSILLAIYPNPYTDITLSTEIFIGRLFMPHTTIIFIFRFFIGIIKRFYTDRKALLGNTICSIAQ